ncbi:patatin-like phospholipase family protein [Aquincola sp. J276]|uniref:patatin-like phospholipase family protein n=1 Tax=Aquincola sp. J276 TaxID=2898432 RepID=UPI0021515278|nr:patatin-like phospholipase family protein [Aquincola sp. J276]MCR5865957.1 patatin-like phospholipase family protein [Aquincola sp. J276]
MLRRRRRAGLKEEVAASGAPRPNARLRELPTVGLALSGGGVRSATYGLGLIRGLAQRGLLPRFDYLSTVSGGGYVGAMLGRLVLALGVRQAQAMLAARRSPLLDWMRRNGRYLTPAGTHDVGVAAVTYLRAFVAIHGELMMAALLFGLLVVAPHLWQMSTDTLDPNAWQAWGSLWLPLATAWMCATLPGLACGYWVAREGPDPTRRHTTHALHEQLMAAALVACALLLPWLAWRLRLLSPLAEGRIGLPLVLLSVASVAAGVATTLVVLARSPVSRGLASARLRRRTTEVTRQALLIAALAVFMGLLDLVSWRLLKLALSDRDWLWGGVGLGGFAALVLRALAQPLQQMVQQASASLGTWTPRLLNAAGVAVLAIVLCFWLSTVQWLVFTPAPLGWLDAVPPVWRAGGIAAWCGLWWLTTAHNGGMANASSLHGFYRARLTRAYLSVGNPNRPVLQPQLDGAHADVTQVVSRDDADLRDYHPERAGGPVHLINTCLNQTRDDLSGLFNADRKGTVLTVRPDGVEIGPRERVCFTRASEVGTLGKWIAISGAAAAPGAGAYTSRGWALLLFLVGVRLGHWVREPAPPQAPRPAWCDALWRLAAKPLMLWSEATATYRGRSRPWWYLSDGGHFDNTGVYALLRREVDFIVLVDASCDARYEFLDLENLVRKARIDFGAEIEFYPHEEATRRFGVGDGGLTVLSPQDMADSQSARGVLLGRIRYLRPAGCAAGTPEHHGTLLVIKPNLHAALDVDVLAYAQRHGRFPHESTGDQSFDEAQWESYHRLGEDAGAALQPAWLERLPGWLERSSDAVEHPARLRQPGRASPDSTPQPEPAWRRAAKNSAIGTTLGLGASGTLLLSLWQVSDQLRQNENAQRAEVRTLFTEVSRALSAVDMSCPKVPAHVTQQVTMLQDLVQNPAVREADRVGVQRLLEVTHEQCRTAEITPSEPCMAAMRNTQDTLCAALGTLPNRDALSYWHPFEVPPARLLNWPRLVALVQDRWRAGGAPPAPVGTPAPAPYPPATGVPPPTAPVPTPEETAAAALQAACRANGVQPLRVYTQVYDEASRSEATGLRWALQQAGGEVLQLAPIENVTRSASLRQQRRPVPWPQPTLVVHQRSDLDCARLLAEHVRQHWGPGNGGEVWVRELPSSLRTSSGSQRVIELWLPPSSASDRGATVR